MLPLVIQFVIQHIKSHGNIQRAHQSVLKSIIVPAGLPAMASASLEKWTICDGMPRRATPINSKHFLRMPPVTSVARLPDNDRATTRQFCRLMTLIRCADESILGSHSWMPSTSQTSIIRDAPNRPGKIWRDLVAGKNRTSLRHIIRRYAIAGWHKTNHEHTLNGG